MKTIDLRDCESIIADRSRSLIEVSTLSEPDPNWSFTDDAGHEHKWSKSDTLPTLVNVCDEWEVDEDGDQYCSRSHYECKKCKQHVLPGTRTPLGPKYVAGLQRLDISASLPTDQWDTLIEILNSGEKCLLLLPHGLPDTPAYLTEVQQTVDGQLSVHLRGA